MAGGYQVLLGGEAMPEALAARLGGLEAEEAADGPGVLQLRFACGEEAGDIAPLNEPGLQPMAGIAVLAQAGEADPTCIFAGHVSGHRLHLEGGVTQSELLVSAQDSSWLMDLEEKAREWVDVDETSVAAAIFGEYGIAPSPANTEEEAPSHTEARRSLMQRATDLQFLRLLARRGGRLLRIAAGAGPEELVGVFAAPDLGAEPVASLRPNDPEKPNLRVLDLEWDVARPSSVVARQAMLDDPAAEGASGDAEESGLRPMDARGLAEFAGRAVRAMLTAHVDDGQALRARASGLLREAGWFVRLTATVDAAVLGTVLRAGQVVTVEGIGSVHSGRYLVWTVRHRIDDAAHRMDVTLVRNAVGPAPGGGGLPKLPGGL